MTTDTFQRKLTAILSADVVGYSRLMRDNEEATVLTLNKYKEMIFGLIERHNGRLVDSPGDNLLAEFTSVVDAVRCGVQIQEDLKANNEELPPNRKMEFRIGINTGDVIQDGDRIYGDGVNVAARIESLADPGGICVSRTAYDQVKNKINIDYEYLGDYEVKNISEPVQVYRIRMEPENETAVVKEKKARVRTWQIGALAVVAIIILGAVAFWYFSFHKVPEVGDVEEAPKTIAVLPFENLSSDPEQVYFVDGLSEEILNSLTKISDIRVIARTSSFSFKGTNKTVQEIASVLGADHILEGSVRKAGNELRVTAQLIQAVDGTHLWSETYDRELKDIFAVQEDIAKAVANELKATLGIGKSLKQLGGTDNVEAYEAYLVAKGQKADYAALKLALESINAAIAIDPKFALAWTLKSIIHTGFTVIGPANRAAIEQDEALHAARKAVELEPNLAAGYYQLSVAEVSRGEFIESELAFRKGIELKTEMLGSETLIATLSAAVGNFKRANELIETVVGKDPLNEIARGEYMLSFAFLGEIKRAEEEYKHGRELFGDDWYHGNTFITSIRLGYDDIVSSDIAFSSPISDVVKANLESPKAGLTALHRIYTDDKNLSSAENIYISIYAAYFGDLEFSMEAMEKGLSIESGGIFNVWFPVMREVRQLPRFKEFVREIGLVDYWNEFGWPDICHKLDNGDFECD